MLDNQGGRRNLSDIDRISIARRKEEILARRAKENQKASDGRGVKGLPKSAKPLQPINTLVEVAKSAGVGKNKYAEGKLILEAVESGEAPVKIFLPSLRVFHKSGHGNQISMELRLRRTGAFLRLYPP